MEQPLQTQNRCTDSEPSAGQNIRYFILPLISVGYFNNYSGNLHHTITIAMISFSFLLPISLSVFLPFSHSSLLYFGFFCRINQLTWNVMRLTPNVDIHKQCSYKTISIKCNRRTKLDFLHVKTDFDVVLCERWQVIRYETT